MTLWNAENIIDQGRNAGKNCNLLIVVEDPDTPEKIDYFVVISERINHEIICEGAKKAYYIINKRNK